MLTKLGKFFFLLIVLGNLSLNHILLGYCQCEGAVFFTNCPCEENRCPCGECPVEDDCSTFLCLELDDFPQALDESKPVLFEELPPAEFLADACKPGLVYQAQFSSNQATGPPGSAVPRRHLYAVYLI